MSAIVNLFYHIKKANLSSRKTTFKLVAFQPRMVNGIKEYQKVNLAQDYDDHSMRLLRIKDNYEFDQCELDSMIIINLELKDNFKPAKLIKDWNDDTLMLRQYGRFYSSKYGLDITMLKKIMDFSTIQSLSNAEVYFVDSFDDQKALELMEKIKRHLLRQGSDPCLESNYPPVFLKRIKEIMGENFAFEDF